MFSEDYESFTESQQETLTHYVTNTSSHIFCLRNLPEVIKGALFSRYSRSSLGLRSLLLKEFVATEESGFAEIVKEKGVSQEEQTLAIKKAQNFYDRILDGYGDDSIGELGGAHIAIENVSMLAAKEIEDCRIGGSPLEKSTRYIYFDQKVKGEYLFYREPILMTSAFRALYIDTCNHLFDTYSKLIPPLTEHLSNLNPYDPNTSKVAYNASLRAKVLDCLRGLLPAGALTNMGLYGNGRFFEGMIHKLHCHKLTELQDIGKKAHEELTKIIPSFVRRSELTHRTHQGYANAFEAMDSEIHMVSEKFSERCDQEHDRGVKLLEADSESVKKVAAAILFAYSNKSYDQLLKCCEALSDEEIEQILDAACSSRENRRHKSPRALEHAQFTFEICSDFGIYRDLHRHRMLTQERQQLTCDYGYYTPHEIKGLPIEGEYHLAMNQAKAAFDQIAKELPEEAQYIVPMAYNVRWYFCINLRALQWMCELRSQAAGHAGYRLIAQQMAAQVSERFPQFERFFKFVDYDGHDLGRMGQELRKAEKLSTQPQ